MQEAALRTYHISDDPANYYLAEVTDKGLYLRIVEEYIMCNLTIYYKYNFRVNMLFKKKIYCLKNVFSRPIIIKAFKMWNMQHGQYRLAVTNHSLSVSYAASVRQFSQGCHYFFLAVSKWQMLVSKVKCRLKKWRKITISWWRIFVIWYFLSRSWCLWRWNLVPIWVLDST